MKRSVRIFWRIFIGGLALFVLLVILCAYGVFGEMPSLKELENPSLLQTSELYASDGTLMGKYYREKGNRSNVEYRDLSQHLINALVATEDERFYSHSGIDFRRTLSAAATLGRRGGASTITQQLAKALLDHQPGKNKANRMIQKLKEWIIAIKLERNFTKEEIIALYLNAVPFGDNIYGIRNATRTFFQKEPDRVNVEEAAMLIGMLKGNSLYNPRRNPKAALDRRNVVLNQMAKNGKISDAEAIKLKAIPIKLNYNKMDENRGYAPYFRDVIREELKEILKDTKNPDGEPYDIYDDGLKIYTTINPRMQEYAEEAVYSHVPVMQKILNSTSYIKDGSIWKEHQNILDAAMKNSDRWQNLADDGLSDKEIKASFYQKIPMKVFAWNAKREKDTIMTPMDSIKYHRQMLQASFMVMDPITGEVRAWVGGISFKTYKYDHVNLKTKRQIGSTVKPLLYAQAIEERGMNAQTELERSAVYFPGSGWVPSQKVCKGGVMSLASALAWSDNCATAHVMQQVGAAQFSDFLSRINIPTRVEAHPANALGACDLSLFELMWGYSIFPGRGFSTKPYFITRIEDRNGNTIKRFDYSVNRKEAISEITAYKMTQLMQGTVDVGTAKGLRGRLGAAAMGGKTGTTNDNTDAWFMGYVPQLEAGGWIGCDDRFIHISKNDERGYGGFAARPIWEYFMKKVYGDKTLGIDRSAVFAKPENMDNEILSADPLATVSDLPPPGAEGVDVGAGTSQDYNNEYIGPESQKVPDDEDKPRDKKDTILSRKENSSSENAKPIGTAVEEKKKKKGFLRRIFDKKDN